ncbi:MAG TPA: amidohydrolase family protein [Blastocatellia bacterium]|nr:amidohydrolase family protein [Blastocatellia bacterium]
MLTLVENGEVYSPETLGRHDLLIVNDRIVMIGEVNRRSIKALGLDLKVIDAAGCVVTPGFIDPHEHLLGGSGEGGFSTQTPEINLGEIVTAGITTVVGALGVDTTTKTMSGLLAKAKALREEGMTAFVWTGGYNVPPSSITDSVRSDIMYIAEVIGAGEVAISDERSTDPTPRELARLVSDAYVGGMLSNKAGVTHFHVGDKEERLKPLRRLVEDFGVRPGLLYPTHVGRDEGLMREAIDLSAGGMFVDVDTVEEDLPKWLRFYLDNGGDPERLTASSDASITSPRNLFAQVRACIVEHGFAIERVLPVVTRNTSEVLKLGSKGRLEAGKDADVLVLRKNAFEIKDVIVGGKHMVEDGRFIASERFLERSNRRVSLRGERLR